jgi:Mrp family chromosome partitioning ATPase
LLDTTPAVPLRLLVIAPRRHTGVTYTAVGLAEAFTRAGRRVVLVDGNFVAPTVHATFGVPMRPGFADVITDATGVSSALTTSPRGIRNLIVVPTGEGSGSDDALGRPGLSAALDAIVAEACPDVLIVDGGALTDATRTSRLLAHYLSHTVLIVTGQTRGRTLRSIATTLTTSGTEIVGVVFNQPGRSHRTSGPSKGRAKHLPKAVMARILSYFGFGVSKKSPKTTGYAYPPGSLASMGPPKGPTDILAED